jgi:hypothetical protein
MKYGIPASEGAGFFFGKHGLQYRENGNEIA